MKIYSEIVKVISNQIIADNIYEAFLYSPKISACSKPGQFINILPSKDWENIMRRPMSIASQNDGIISVIYKVFGEGTKLMSQWETDDKIDIIGPLGNTWFDYDTNYPILIGGGVGIAPIMNLHCHLESLNIKHSLICGARTKGEHFLDHMPNKSMFLSTDLDDYGIKGTVINALDQILKNMSSPIKIFSCGPHGMLKAIYEYSSKNNFDCQLAVETIMACGIGICQGCTIVKKDSGNLHSYRNKYALACIDGPVFDIKDLSDAF